MNARFLAITMLVSILLPGISHADASIANIPDGSHLVVSADLKMPFIEEEGYASIQLNENCDLRTSPVSQSIVLHKNSNLVWSSYVADSYLDSFNVFYSSVSFKNSQNANRLAIVCKGGDEGVSALNLNLAQLGLKIISKQPSGW